MLGLFLAVASLTGADSRKSAFSPRGARPRSLPVMTGDAPEPDTTVLAPAKVNLFLRILRRRDDGFHELASLFQAISVCDTLRVWKLDPSTSVASSMSIVQANDRESAELTADEDNLVLRAIRVFEEKSGIVQPLRVELEKCIPIQAGLGGGSADAAAALFAANRLAGYPASMADLRSWAGDLGSDVSFFFSTGTAYCTGRGEKISSLPPLDPADVLIVKPTEGLSTALVYQTLDLSRLSTVDPVELLAALRMPDGLLKQDSYVNDLEGPALELQPRLAEIKATLKSRGWQVVLMSGSGTSIFALGEPEGMPLSGWQEDLQAECLPARFMARDATDETRWYGE